MSAQASACATQLGGLPVTQLQLPCGDRLVVAAHGAQVLSWVAGGRERLYLSPQCTLDGQAAIRGGIPVCFPQFNQRGPLPKHGFARKLPWTVNAPRLEADAAHLVLSLADSEQTRRWWDHAFEAQLRIALKPSTLQVGLAVRNTDARPLSFSGALHTYLAVDDVAQARLLGLEGRPEWNAVTDGPGTAAPELLLAGEFDRVYTAAPAGYTLLDGPHTLRIEQDPGWSQTVVWNPGADLCATLADMPTGGWRHMLCVEAAQVDAPMTLAPGDCWQGAQRLTVPS